MSAGGAGDEGGDDVHGVPVEGHPSPVVAHRGSGIGVTGCFLDVTERDASVEGGDESVPEGVRTDGLVDACLAGETTNDAPGGVAVEPPAVAAKEDRPLDPLTDRQVDGTGGAWGELDGDDLAALSGMVRVRCPAFEAELVDVLPSASETGSPLMASSYTSACSLADASPATTRSAPTSLRSSPVACDS